MLLTSDHSAFAYFPVSIPPPIGPFLYNSREKWQWGKWDQRKENMHHLSMAVMGALHYSPTSAAWCGQGYENSPQLQLVTNDGGVRIIPVAATDCAPSSICIYFHGAFKLMFATSKPHWPWSRKESQNPLIANKHLNILRPSSVNIFPHKQIQPEQFGLQVHSPGSLFKWGFHRFNSILFYLCFW